MFATTWEDFCRVFHDKYDTYWWLGSEYFKKFGNVWPHEGETPPDGYVYSSGKDLLTSVMLAIVLTIVRFTFERVIAEPIGYMCGLRHTLPGQPSGPNDTLEALIRKSKKPSEEEITQAAKDAGLEIRSVEIWIRRRTRELMPSKLNKFKEATWRLLFYTFVFSYGMTTLWQEDYFWDTMLCWIGYPDVTWAVKKKIYYYYLLEGSFYLSLMFSQFLDTKRKDFWEMFAHHIATLSLIGGSWFGGAYRMGSLVMVTHDVADVFLEAAKLTIYLKKTFWSNTLFAGFTVSFFLSRLVFFPIKILKASIIDASFLLPVWPVHIIYSIFLMILQLLHIYWFSYIIKLLIRVAGGADVEKDDRSDDEETPVSSSAEDKKDQ